jgi:hypothetical protein
MKIKPVLLIVVVVSLFIAFSQKQSANRLYTFCDKTGDCTMSFDEFKKCAKTLNTIEKDLKVLSFVVSAKVITPDKKGSYFEDYPNMGSSFSNATIEWLEKIIAEKRLDNNRILIEEVKLIQGDKTLKTSGMIIKLK